MNFGLTWMNNLVLMLCFVSFVNDILVIKSNFLSFFCQCSYSWMRDSLRVQKFETLITFLSPGQTDKHCLPNISNFARQTCLPVWPPQQILLDKHILIVNVFEIFQKHFLLVTSKKCLSSTCLCSGQTNKHCAWQTKLPMFAKQCLSVWPGLYQVISGNDQNSPTNQWTFGSKLERTNKLTFCGSRRHLKSFPGSFLAWIYLPGCVLKYLVKRLVFNAAITEKLTAKHCQPIMGIPMTWNHLVFKSFGSAIEYEILLKVEEDKLWISAFTTRR